MKKLTTAKIWQFAAGQFGWALLSGIISNWLVYFYQPDETAISQGQTVFIPQGLVIFGVFTIIGGITAFGRIFAAFTAPMIASWSDRCTSKNGRRIPFLKGASLPLALSTVLVFWSPANENSWINAAFLFVMILAYYLSITAYCTPYNALIPELGHTQQERLNISTIISFTFIAGTAVAYLAPTIWGALIPSFGRVNSKCDPGHLHSHGAGSFRMHARAGILHPGKRLRRYRSFEGFRLPFPCGNLSKRRIPKIRGIRYLLLDRTYHVPDGPSVFSLPAC